MGRHLVRSFLLISSIVLVAFSCHAQSPVSRSVRLNGGLIGHVLKIGRSNSNRDIAATISIENTGPTTAYLMQVGPVSISDNVGNSFETVTTNGIGLCNTSVDNAASGCLGLKYPDQARALQTFTRVDPGRTITINIFFRTGGRHGGPVMAITMNALARFVLDTDRDIQIPDRVKYQQFGLINIGFPPLPVQDE